MIDLQVESTDSWHLRVRSVLGSRTHPAEKSIWKSWHSLRAESIFLFQIVWFSSHPANHFKVLELLTLMPWRGGGSFVILCSESGFGWKPLVDAGAVSLYFCVFFFWNMYSWAIAGIFGYKYLLFFSHSRVWIRYTRVLHLSATL